MDVKHGFLQKNLNPDLNVENEVSEENKGLHGTGSVSYTHLDVYKRQVVQRRELTSIKLQKLVNNVMKKFTFWQYRFRIISSRVQIVILSI